MTKLLAPALLLALAGPGRAADPVDPAGAGTVAATDAGAGAKRAAKDARKRRDAEKPRGGAEGKAASPKDEAPCQPVKPCPID